LFGGIDYIQNTSVGRLIIILNGDPMKAQEGLDYIRTLPIESEVIGYVRASN
jgi:D-methionine transport system ATP-binding protein